MVASSHLAAKLRRIAVVGNYVPRRCGIATFTSDLVEALVEEAPKASVWALAINDIPEGYAYPPRVRFEIAEQELADYRTAAEFLNMSEVDVVSLQHEFGIFGGDSGGYILRLVGDLQMPLVTTLHTVLKEPNAVQREIMVDLARASDRLVVMSNLARDFLRDIYRLPEQKIAVIHHGIPDVPFVDPNYYKDQFGVEGKRVILTFGLLSPNKGIENMIRALPQIVQAHPDVVYIVLGVTHPNVKEQQGESYRIGLHQLAKELGVAQNLMLLNRFVELDELSEYLGMADIYVTPYTNEAQITSGTLAYAMGSGTAVVSTPYWYAEEMLAHDRGRLVPFNDTGALAKEINDLLDNDIERNAMRKRAYLFGREAIWPHVGRQYLRLFREVREERMMAPRHLSFPRRAPRRAAAVPAISLGHLVRMTDSTGLLQHAKYNVPDREHGYCTDDNARALIVSTIAEGLGDPHDGAADLSTRYLSFLLHAFNEKTGRFRNFMTYDRRWLEEQGSEDSHGRALWALGVAVERTADAGRLAVAARLFDRGLSAAQHFTNPRPWAFVLLGLDSYLRRYTGDSKAKRLRLALAERLLAEFKANAASDWPWPEDVLTYDNGRLPQALILSGYAMGREDMLRTGLESLSWLVEIQTDHNYFVPVGNAGWYERDGDKARFDQQPLEAAAMVDACLAAHLATGENSWVDSAAQIFSWFLGENDLGVRVCDPATGGCRDGIRPDGLNKNQGAESSLSWLLAILGIHTLQESALTRFAAGQRSGSGEKVAREKSRI